MNSEPWWTVSVPSALAGAGHLSPQARYLYMLLLSQADDSRCVRATLADLAAKSGIYRASLVQHLGQLEQAGWVAIDRGRGQSPSTYELAWDGPGSAAGVRRAVRIPGLLLTAASMPLAAKCLYAFLLALGAPETGEVVLARLELISRAGVGRDAQVRAALRHLIEHGWLRVEHNVKQRVVSYVPHDPHLAARLAERDLAEKRLARAEFAGETLLKLMLTALVADSDYVENGRPGKMTNPYTGEPLEFDRWYVGGQVAFEFNGPQHDRPTDDFPDPHAVARQRGRDLMKMGLAVEHNIELIVVKPRELTFPTLAEKIGDLLPLRALPKEDPVVAYLTQMSRRYVRAVRRGSFRASRPRSG